MFYLNSATIFFVKISACLITFNEAEKIAEAVQSLGWADEILVVDSESTDATRAIAESFGARVLIRKWEGFSKQKQYAADHAAHDWIFSLDADERVSDELKTEILRLKNSDENGLADGFRIPRLAFYMNRPIRHGGWYPDWQLRFYNRRKGRWKAVLVHESVQMNESAKVEKLRGDILHYSVENASHHHRMIGTRYAPLAAEQMFVRGKTVSAFKIVTVGLTTFLQNYILKGGFLDGLAGFCIARFAAHHAFLKYLLLWEMQNRKPETTGQISKANRP
ncbi:MAG: glycosyltransferase family 2 protein [Pyrinomonadaceae bacterium]|nr:glycosyltransferase family 2 protein [Pyrinomonadaceae bacterium]